MEAAGKWGMRAVGTKDGALLQSLANESLTKVERGCSASNRRSVLPFAMESTHVTELVDKK